MIAQEHKSKESDSIPHVIDLSTPMKSMDTPVYPGYPQPLRATFSTVRDNGYASFVWTFVEHTSTHVDSPGHFSEGSKMIDQVPLNKYVGKGIVLDFTDSPQRYSIKAEDISSMLHKSGKAVGPGWMIFFHTGYTEKSRTKDWLEHPELSEEACNYLVKLGVEAVGFDAPGPDHQPFPAHKILLPKEISIYENLANLDRVLDKDFLFVGAPLALVGGSASPCRALALVF